MRLAPDWPPARIDLADVLATMGAPREARRATIVAATRAPIRRVGRRARGPGGAASL